MKTGATLIHLKGFNKACACNRYYGYYVLVHGFLFLNPLNLW